MAGMQILSVKPPRQFRFAMEKYLPTLFGILQLTAQVER